MIFDDIVDEKNQSKVENYYTRGRRINIDCFKLFELTAPVGQPLMCT
jgi:hypothetical protein